MFEKCCQLIGYPKSGFVRSCDDNYLSGPTMRASGVNDARKQCRLSKSLKQWIQQIDKLRKLEVDEKYIRCGFIYRYTFRYHSMQKLYVPRKLIKNAAADSQKQQ